MSFAIEVSGEANPLTEGMLLHVLKSASSNDQHQIQTGTKQLQNWEKAAGYYKHLQSVFIDRSLPFEVRYLAIIQLKNGIEKYWRKTATKWVTLDPILSFLPAKSGRYFHQNTFEFLEKLTLTSQ